jgi:phospholipase/carboxylesterase
MTFKPVGNVRRLADLECVVVDPTEQAYEPQVIVVLCHGFGASGTDLVDCCRAMWELQPEELRRARFVFPAAPMSLDRSGLYDSRAWWPIDMERLNEMIANAEFRDLRHDKPEPLEMLRVQMTLLIRQLLAETNLDHGSIVLGGFSQGAMLSTDVALHLDPAPGGLIVWSGTLLNELEWRPAASQQSKFPIFQSHGRFDPILPFAAAQWLHEMLTEAGFDAEFTAFDGMHEIPMAAMRGAAKLAAEVAERG